MHEPTDPYYHNERPDLLPLVPQGVRRALDVGCGAGAFGAALKARFGAEVWGIEAVPEVAAIAEGRLERVLLGDADEMLRQAPKASFDLISFNDILEHLPWPDRTLALARPLLAPGGRVLASLPNVRYWHNLYHLLVERDFRYEDSGIRDRTHLRFFTRKSAARLFSENGWEIERFEDLNKTRSKPLRILVTLLPRQFSDCYPLQFGIVARPT